jgi:hypothetical protein
MEVCDGTSSQKSLTLNIRGITTVRSTSNGMVHRHSGNYTSCHRLVKINLFKTPEDSSKKDSSKKFRKKKKKIVQKKKNARRKKAMA